MISDPSANEFWFKYLLIKFIYVQNNAIIYFIEYAKITRTLYNNCMH